jgi:hypothetical protein
LNDVDSVVQGSTHLVSGGCFADSLFLEEHGGTWWNISDSDLRRFFQMAQIVPRDLRMLYPDASATQLHQADNIGLFSYVFFK